MPIAIFVFLLLAGASPAAAASGSPPVVAAFTATPAKAITGQSSTLSWSVKGATTLAINAGVGPVTGTSVKVKPAATTTYTLTATNTSGSTTATATVMVGSPPIITSLTATPAKVAPGQLSTLSWTATGAPSVSINSGVGAVSGTSVNVRPSATTTYFLTALNAFGASAATVTVMVGRAPTIASFTATPAKVISGQSSTLAWIVTGSPSVSINSGVGAVTATSVKVTPPATTSYTLTATNAFGSITAAVTVAAGSLPTIASFTASPAKVTTGQSSTLSWVAAGAPALSINSGVGAVTGTSVTVRPRVTSAFTLTATNTFGSVTAAVSVTVGSPPAIVYFSAAPATLTAGQSTALSWNVTGSTSLSIDSGVGAVTGNLVTVRPPATTTYTLTAANSFGSATASATATVNTPSPPVINSFIANPGSIGPGVTPILYWTTTGATSLSIDQGVGAVTGNTVTVHPTSATTYTLTATNALGSVTATVAVSYIPLIAVNSQLYYTEHVLFIIPPPSQVTWTGSNSWGSVYLAANVNSYVSTLKSTFPSDNDYFFVVVAANNLTPVNVPSVMDYRHLADGIGGAIAGVGVPDICLYHIGTGTVVDGAFGVLDHEIGHNWEVFVGFGDTHGHWPASSTATGQMAATYSDDGYATIKQISGDPANGFTWTAVDNIAKNETETFSEQDLYLQGFGAAFPDTYVLNSPVYNPDQTVASSSATKYDQAWVVGRNGVRNPSYQVSPKRLRMGVVYIARDLAEIQAVYQPIERSMNHFVNAEQIDTTAYRFQVPFLVDTQYRASVDALLADLDGNGTPTLSIPGATYLVSSDGAATVPFTAADPDGPAPAVSCVPASPNCSIAGGSVALTGLASGTHFITIKAQDTGGKKTFAHFVVDVQ